MVEPPPAYFCLLFVDVLADVPDRCAVIAVQLDGGGETERPLREVVDDMPPVLKPCCALFFTPWAARLAAIGRNDRPAVNDAQGVIKEAVEVYCAILVQLRHKDVLQPVPPDLIVEPLIELACDRRDVVAINALRVKCQRHKIAKVIAQRQISNIRTSAALCPQP